MKHAILECSSTSFEMDVLINIVLPFGRKTKMAKKLSRRERAGSGVGWCGGDAKVDEI